MVCTVLPCFSFKKKFSAFSYDIICHVCMYVMYVECRSFVLFIFLCTLVCSFFVHRLGNTVYTQFVTDLVASICLWFIWYLSSHLPLVALAPLLVHMYVWPQRSPHVLQILYLRYFLSFFTSAANLSTTTFTGRLKSHTFCQFYMMRSKELSY